MTKVININEIDIENVTDKLLQAVLICLFTDAEAEDGELPTYTQRQAGGWWGDEIETVVKGKQTKFSWGSKLWMLSRAKMTTDEANTASLLVEECLSPLVEAGFIAENTVTTELQGSQLIITVPLEHETYEIKGIE